MKRRAAAKRPRQTRNRAGLAPRFGAMLPKPTAEASACLAAWPAHARPKSVGKALTTLLRGNPALARVLGGIVEAAPYLWNAIEAKPARLLRLLGADPVRSLAALVQKTKVAAARAPSQLELMRILREFKLESALLIALADIGGVWALPQITEALTRVADIAVALTVNHLLKDAVRQKKLKSADPNNPQSGCGYIVIAMGKMGAGELNFSSDIDLMVFFDAGVSLADDVESAPFFIGVTRDLIKILQTRTSDGYVFRVDLRLRPDPSSTQIAISTAAALDYYESRGQNWERAALIKARVCAGDIAAGEQFLRDLSPFIWRKYLDYAAIAHVHEMKQQIHAYRGHGEIAVEGHNIKLGRGGIREIEFFVQTQQLIAGGRHPQLRRRETLATLRALADGGWVDAATSADLEDAYRFLRMVEHRLQMVADEQTHTLPSRRDELDRFARFLGYVHRDAFAQVLLRHLRAVESRYARLFEHASLDDAERRGLVFPPQADAKDTLAKLSEMGFRHPMAVSATVRDWLAGQPRGLKGETARTHFATLAPLLIDHIARAENPDAALAAFDRFLGNLHGGARLFALLQQNPDLVALVARVLGAAPRLADTLALHPEVLDPLIDPAFFGALPGRDRLAAALERSLRQAGSYEDFLDRVRRFGQEQGFLIGARILSGTVSAQQAGEAFAAVADTIVRALHAKVTEVFRVSHGAVQGGDAVVLAMGKLGGREMAANSDLDLIVVYDFDPA